MACAKASGICLYDVYLVELHSLTLRCASAVHQKSEVQLCKPPSTNTFCAPIDGLSRAVQMHQFPVCHAALAWAAAAHLSF
jgi:hypothetical protein